MIERSRRVVLLIDYDNLQICAARDTPGRDLQLTPVVQLAQRYGSVILARAYAEWNLSTERLAVYKAGIEPAFAPVLRTDFTAIPLREMADEHITYKQLITDAGRYTDARAPAALPEPAASTGLRSRRTRARDGREPR